MISKKTGAFKRRQGNCQGPYFWHREFDPIQGRGGFLFRGEAWHSNLVFLSYTIWAVKGYLQICVFTASSSLSPAHCSQAIFPRH